MNRYVVTLWTFLLLACPATAEINTLSGRVVDREGLPVPGATIELLGEDFGNPVPATSGKDGAFTVRGFRPAQYTLAISASGFEMLERVVPVRVTGKSDLGQIALRKVDCNAPDATCFVFRDPGSRSVDFIFGASGRSVPVGCAVDVYAGRVSCAPVGGLWSSDFQLIRIDNHLFLLPQNGAGLAELPSGETCRDVYGTRPLALANLRPGAQVCVTTAQGHHSTISFLGTTNDSDTQIDIRFETTR